MHLLEFKMYLHAWVISRNMKFLFLSILWIQLRIKFLRKNLLPSNKLSHSHVIKIFYIEKRKTKIIKIIIKKSKNLSQHLLPSNRHSHSNIIKILYIKKRKTKIIIHGWEIMLESNHIENRIFDLVWLHDN